MAANTNKRRQSTSHLTLQKPQPQLNKVADFSDFGQRFGLHLFRTKHLKHADQVWTSKNIPNRFPISVDLKFRLNSVRSILKNLRPSFAKECNAKSPKKVQHKISRPVTGTLVEQLVFFLANASDMKRWKIFTWRPRAEATSWLRALQHFA